MSCLDLQRLVNVFRSNLHAATSTAGPMDSVSTVWIVYGRLRGSRASQVSPFAFLLLFVIEALDLEPCRFDLHAAALTPESNDSIGMFGIISAWLRGADAFEVSHFDFTALADFCRFNLDPSASPSTRNVSVRTLCRMDRWHRRHW